MRKKAVSILIAAMAFTGLLAGCGGTQEPETEVSSGAVGDENQDADSGEAGDEAAGTDSPDAAAGSPAVYLTTDISSDGLMAVYEALRASPEGKIAVKLSTGEPGSNYLRTELIGELVQSFDEATIVECNTAYGGSRASTAMHYQVAEDHGYTEIADVDIMDEEGSMTLPVAGGANLEENYVGSHFADYDYYVVLSHFKGHSMAEAGKSVADYLDGNIVYINVMNRLSVDCDCDGNPAEPDMHAIGILASYDPVALDQACVDLVYSAQDGNSLVERIESRNGFHTLEHAEEIGLGSRTYELVNIDGEKDGWRED